MFGQVVYCTRRLDLRGQGELKSSPFSVCLTVYPGEGQLVLEERADFDVFKAVI